MAYLGSIKVLEALKLVETSKRPAEVCKVLNHRHCHILLLALKCSTTLFLTVVIGQGCKLAMVLEGNTTGNAHFDSKVAVWTLENMKPIE